MIINKEPKQEIFKTDNILTLKKKKFLLDNLDCVKEHGNLRCTKCNLKIIENILCFENFDNVDSLKSLESLKKKRRYSSWKKFNFLKAFIELSKKNEQNILDIGSGRHFIEEIYGELKKNTFYRLDIANRSYVDVIADFSKYHYFKKCFDVILCLNVIEHVYNFKPFINNIGKVIKSKGTLLLTVPYKSGLHYLPNDYFRPSHYALEKILKESDFETIHIEPFYVSWITTTLNQIKKNYESSSFFLKLLLKFTTYQLRLINKFNNFSLENKLIDDVKDNKKKFYTEPLGYFVKAIKK